MSEWKEEKISNLCSLIVDCVNRTAPVVNYVTPYKMIRTTNVRDGKINKIDVRCVTEETYKSWIRRGKPKKDDIILTREAPVGEVGIVATDDKIFLGQRTMLYRANSTIIDAKFLYYSFHTSYVREQILNTGMGSVVEHIRVPDAKEFLIKFPALPEQKAIAAVLSSLDDKIYLLHRQNQTLEALAETLFRQWFVEQAEEDWETKKLGDMVTVKRGGSPRPIQDFLSETGLRWLKISDATKTASPYIFDIKEHIMEEGLNKTTLLRKGALVLSNSATPGIPKILQVETCIHDGWLHFPKSSLSNEFLYLLFKRIRPELLNQGNGSIFTNLKTDILKEYELSFPTNKYLDRFQNLIEPLFDKMLFNSEAINVVEKLRDGLLPKLMSGEVKVLL
jgi:type I restriction enzyme S subunit